MLVVRPRTVRFFPEVAGLRRTLNLATDRAGKLLDDADRSGFVNLRVSLTPVNAFSCPFLPDFSYAPKVDFTGQNWAFLSDSSALARVARLS